MTGIRLRRTKKHHAHYMQVDFAHIPVAAMRQFNVFLH